MDIKEIIKLQNKFDYEHGWALKSNDTKEKVKLINSDIIGIFGEMGEFSNLIKKLNLDLERVKEIEFEDNFSKMRGDLEEELIDAFIYLIRIASHLDMDMTEKYLYKMKKNRERFKRYEIDK
jgi:NTP pyrophosphatase (non-canonical NTP hydrolase)